MLWCIGILFLVIAAALPAAVITFEDLNEGDFVAANYSGLTFANAIVLTAGSLLNELEFPPESGVNVVSDLDGPITIFFALPVVSVDAYFTYAVPLSMAAYSGSNQLLGLAVSQFTNNEALSGDLGSFPNELLSIAAGSAIDHITVTGLATGGSFVLDDLSFTVSPDTEPVPEPGTFVLVSLSALFAHSVLRRSKRRASRRLSGHGFGKIGRSVQ